MTNPIDLTADIIDTRDIITRFEELEGEQPQDDNDVRNWSDLQEFTDLGNILEELKGNGGDEQWRGDWYPITLIRESHFKDYAQELAEDCGMIPANAQWPNNCIDWVQAARELRMDYTSTDIDGVEYFYR